MLQQEGQARVSRAMKLRDCKRSWLGSNTVPELTRTHEDVAFDLL